MVLSRKCRASSALLLAVTMADFTAGVGNSQEDVQIIHMYRAQRMPALEDVHNYELSNNNLADIIGVLRYIHQDVVPEHTASDSRSSRKYGIDSISRFMMKVRNPPDMEEQSVVGFGEYGAFEYGVSTTDIVTKQIVQAGDFVGASTEKTPQIKFFREWYWFSVTGNCPNLPWQCIQGTENPRCNTSLDTWGIVPAQCENTGCAGKNENAARLCTVSPQFADPTNEKLKRTCCLRYSDSPPDHPQVIRGGLCDFWNKDDRGDPDGQRGCVYSYPPLHKSDFLMLDDLVGITSLPCGSKGLRKCKDWLDWRRNCYDPHGIFRRQFYCDDCHADGGWNVKVVQTQECIEYDIHPRCQDSENLCDDPVCQGLLPEQKEFGLEFWTGKCDPRKNALRAERIAEFFLGNGTRGTHSLVDPLVTGANPTCREKWGAEANMCTPEINGGPYCTRTFADICSVCYIPGTHQPFFRKKLFPMCPYNIFLEKGQLLEPGTTCVSRNARDLCCLYGVPGFECEQKLSNTDDVFLDKMANYSIFEDGYALAAQKQNTEVMRRFIERWIVKTGGDITDHAEVAKLAYWYWDAKPLGAPVDQLQTLRAELIAKGLAVWDGHRTTQAPGTHTTAAPAAKGDGSGGVPPVLIVAIIVVAMSVPFLFISYRRNQAALLRQRLLEQQVSHPVSATASGVSLQPMSELKTRTEG